jgi:DNA-binding response OmpR family regulator
MNPQSVDVVGSDAQARDDPSIAVGGATLRVLVVESESQAAETLVHGLRRHGYLAESVATGAAALRAHLHADLVLLELDLPDLDGMEVCRRIRALGDVPVIILTAREAELDCVLGLQAGSDDFISKPYSFRVLLARIEALMRRVKPGRAAARMVTRGPLRIDAGNRELVVEGRRVELTPKEFDLLHLLASQPDTTFSRRQLMSQVWDDDSARGRTLDTHISSLRGKLGSSGWIVTVRGVGFRLGHPRRTGAAT